MKDQLIKDAYHMLGDYAELIWFKGEAKVDEFIKRNADDEEEPTQEEIDRVFQPYSKKYSEIHALRKELWSVIDEK